MTNKPHTLIVAHGSPSDADRLENEIQGLARQVQSLTPSQTIGAATLAKAGALEAALDQNEDQPVTVYPFFVSAGWFVETELVRRCREATDRALTFLQPFGLDTGIPKLCIELATAASNRAGLQPSQTVLILAGHGSRRGTAAAAPVLEVANQLRTAGMFGDVRAGFVEQHPTITEAASGLEDTPALCLPFFATVAGHVLLDVPEQLQVAGFSGEILPPVGAADAVPTMIARAVASERTPASLRP